MARIDLFFDELIARKASDLHLLALHEKALGQTTLVEHFERA